MGQGTASLQDTAAHSSLQEKWTVLHHPTHLLPPSLFSLQLTKLKSVLHSEASGTSSDKFSECGGRQQESIWTLRWTQAGAKLHDTTAIWGSCTFTVHHVYLRAFEDNLTLREGLWTV